MHICLFFVYFTIDFLFLKIKESYSNKLKKKEINKIFILEIKIHFLFFLSLFKSIKWAFPSLEQVNRKSI
jgi:hypothetical protein